MIKLRNARLVIRHQANGHYYAVETNNRGRVVGRSERLDTEMVEAWIKDLFPPIGDDMIKFIVERDDAAENYDDGDYEVVHSCN